MGRKSGLQRVGDQQPHLQRWIEELDTYKYQLLLTSYAESTFDYNFSLPPTDYRQPNRNKIQKNPSYFPGKNQWNNHANIFNTHRAITKFIIAFISFTIVKVTWYFIKEQCYFTFNLFCIKIFLNQTRQGTKYNMGQMVVFDEFDVFNKWFLFLLVRNFIQRLVSRPYYASKSF